MVTERSLENSETSGLAMFDTCDWVDAGEDVTLSPAAAGKKTMSLVREKGTTSRKKRLKRNRHLLEVLRSLNTSSSLHLDLPPPPEPAAKRPATDVMSAGSPPAVEAPAAQRPPESAERLSRRQWRNKLKNKKKNRNKFKVIRGTGAPEGARDRGAGATADSEEKPPNHGDRKIKSQQGKQNWGKGEETSPPPRGPTRKRQLMTPQDRARLQKLKKIMQHHTAETPRGEDPQEPPREQPEAKRDRSAETPSREDPQEPPREQPEAERDRSAELRSRMEQRLNSARFRYINQQLYTADSQEALQLFQQDPEAFSIYHSGFSQQLQRWPVSPITQIIKYIKNRSPALVVADFGCGDALLARSVRNKVHSFDLVALNDYVTVCDMAKVPLLDGSVDVVVFCLSLMGKNLGDFLQEANRVLKSGGVLLVAEVSSRFDDVRQFLSAMSHLGFKAINKNTDNKFFFFFEFSKTGNARNAAKHPGLQLKPCLYKKR